MAKIPLRTYTKDVENLIERGEIEQAIAHAKNILKSFPKHIETYRLLGKAYLESQRYSEATDILQRLLSVVPDDFVSQIGMSIIREDEGNLDAAIWHMERAYEVQPFNPAVQDELRRLYGRRDGIEPPKIRLTRGALIRMYARGELYPQAIAETRAVLAEDPQRLDLQVLLARLYFLAGQKVEATEVCSSLIGKLPYCYEANLILSEVLPGTSRADDARTFQQRLYALDPYAAFLSPNAPTADLVPDQAVTVEQFTFDASAELDQRPDWARTVGVEWQETEEEQLPDWLNNLSPQAAAPAQAAPALVESEPATPAGGEDDIVPDWMKEAGWTKTDRSADEIMQEQLHMTGDESENAVEAAPGEIPDWLQTIAPTLEPENMTAEQERLDLLDSILPDSTEGADASGSDAAAIDWLTGATGAALGATAAGAVDESSPLFTDERPGDGETEPAAASVLPPFGEEETGPGDIPEWLSGLGQEAGAALTGDTELPTEPAETTPAAPGWLRDFDSGETVIQPAADAGETPPGDLPDWLQSAAASADMQPGETTPDTDSAWLSQLGAAESALEGEIPGEAPPAGETDAGLPEWMQSFGQEPAAEREPDADTSWASTSWMTSPEDERAAAEQPPELAQPSEDAVPEWLQGGGADTIIAVPGTAEDGAQETEAAAPEMPEGAAYADTAAGADAGAEFPPAGELPAVLDEIDAAMPLPDLAAPDINEAPAGGEEAAAEFPDFADADAAMAWLESLAARQGADEETLTTRPEDRLDTPPDWVLEAGGFQDGAPQVPTADVDGAPARDEFSGELAVNRLLDGEIFPADAGAQPPVEAGSPGWAAVPESEQQPPADEVALPSLEETAAPSGEDLWLAFESGESGELPQAEAGLEGISTGLPIEEAAPEQPLDRQETQAAESAAPMPDTNDMDAAMAWLESLAAKQGAEEETLVTPPEDRTDQPPDWLQQQEAASKEITQPVRVRPAGEQPPAGEIVAPPGPGEPQPLDTSLPDAESTAFAAVQPDVTEEPAVVDAEIPAWMQGDTPLQIAEAEAPVASLDALLEGYDLPLSEESAPQDALQTAGMGEADQSIETPAALTESGAMPDLDNMDVDATMAWLESLAARQGADEDSLLTRPEDRVETPPEWLQAAEPVGEDTIISAGEITAGELPEPIADEFTGEQAVSRLLDGETLPLEETTHTPEAREAGWPAGESLEQEFAQPQAAEETPPVETTAQPAAEAGEEASAAAATPGEMDFDATFAWLESLAARQGAEEGSLITAPEAREEETPEWLQAAAGEEAQAGEPGPWSVEDAAAPEPQVSDLPAGEAATWAESALEEEPLIDQSAPANRDAAAAEWLPEMPEAGETAAEPLPDWLQQVEPEAEGEPAAAPAAEASLEEWLQSLESESIEPPAEFESEPLAAAAEDAWQVEEPAQPIEIDPTLTGQEALAAAQIALNRGQLETALDAYNRFIAGGEMLEEVIHDLRDALYRFPVDISVWQSLGDAYARNNQLQEALDAYTKAEELLR